MRKLAAYWKGGNSPEARIYNLAVILSPSQKLSIYKVCYPHLLIAGITVPPICANTMEQQCLALTSREYYF